MNKIIIRVASLISGGRMLFEWLIITELMFNIGLYTVAIYWLVEL